MDIEPVPTEHWQVIAIRDALQAAADLETAQQRFAALAEQANQIRPPDGEIFEITSGKDPLEMFEYKRGRSSHLGTTGGPFHANVIVYLGGALFEAFNTSKSRRRSVMLKTDTKIRSIPETEYR